MKKTILILLLFIAWNTDTLHAQNDLDGHMFLPLKSSRFPMFGKDIIINDQSVQNQKDVMITQAFNGWLYAGYWYRMDNSRCNITILKSTDKGMNWEFFKSFETGFPNQRVATLDIKACGKTLDDLKLFIGALRCDTNGFDGDAFVTRFNALTGEPEAEVLQCYSNDIRGICLSTDFGFSSPGSNPNSIAIIYSDASWMHDTVICKSSTDGGYTFQKNGIAGSPHVIAGVTMAYGSCLSFNSGRYYAAWEEKSSLNESIGHIYTAHSEPTISSPFTVPVCLDILDPNNSNQGRNPKISCQYGLMDNDSSNLTSLIVFEKYNQAAGSFDIYGYYNLQATTTDYFQPTSFTNTAHNNIQPDIEFNPYDSCFLATFFDDTEHGLPLLKKKLTFENPQSWSLITSEYNDDPVFENPFPKVIVNNENQSEANVWISENSAGKGVAMFDASYSIYTGWNDGGTYKRNEIKTYPNPCSSVLSIEFEMEIKDNVIITIDNMLGQSLEVIRNNNLDPGKHVLQVDLSSFNDGCYFYKFDSQEYSSIGKIQIQK